MANIIDYLHWRGDLAFSASPFCEVDNLILSMLSLVDYGGIIADDVLPSPIKLSDCYKKYKEIHPNGEEFGAIVPVVMNDLFELVAKSARFSDLYVTSYREKSSEAEFAQFAAITFVLPDNSVFVSYRGTDDTLNGWREDFNLSFTYPVVAQKMAAEYLTDIASMVGGKIRLGGHSKGGHLAIFAAAFAPKNVRERIITAYSNDGPGFVEEVIESEGYRELSDCGKLAVIVPQSSVIGMLLEHSEDYTVIESTMSNGLFQHDPFSWSVIGNRFVHSEKLSKSGEMHDAVLGKWLGEMSVDQRREFTETMFGIIESTGAKTLSDFAVDGFGKLSAAIRAIGGMDKETRENMTKIVRRLAEVSVEWRKNNS